MRQGRLQLDLSVGKKEGRPKAPRGDIPGGVAQPPIENVSTSRSSAVSPKFHSPFESVP